MQQRGALAITGGRVWVPFGGLDGDCGGYKGRVVGVAPRRLRRPDRVHRADHPRGRHLDAAGAERRRGRPPVRGGRQRRIRPGRSLRPQRLGARDRRRRRARRLVLTDHLGHRQRGRPRPRLAGPGARRQVDLHRRQVRHRRTCCGAAPSAGSAARSAAPTCAGPSAGRRWSATSSTCRARTACARCASTGRPAARPLARQRVDHRARRSSAAAGSGRSTRRRCAAQPRSQLGQVVGAGQRRRDEPVRDARAVRQQVLVPTLAGLVVVTSSP